MSFVRVSHALRRSVGPPHPRLFRRSQKARSSSSSTSGSSTSKSIEPSPVFSPDASVPSSTVPSTAASVSGVWVYLQPITYPFRMYSSMQTRRPYITQVSSAVVIWFLGDLSSQMIQIRGSASTSPSTSHNDTQSTTRRSSSPKSNSQPPQTQTYDPIRALRAILIGAISSIPSYHYFLLLHRSFNIPLRPYLSLSIKVLVNQLTFAPLFNTYFFGMQSLLSYPPEGDQPAAAWRRIRDTVPQSWVASCQFWPIVTSVNFTWVEPRFRSVVAGVVAIGWQTYLGVLNQRAARRAREEGAVAG